MTAVFHTVEGHALSRADRDHVAEFTQHVHAASNLPEAVRDAIAAALDLVAVAMTSPCSKPLHT